jgi:hypothetical protein
VARGSVSVAIGGVTLVDDSNGNLVAQSGFTGTVDYGSGAVSLAKNVGTSGSATYSAAQAVAIAAAGHTESTLVSIGNRGYNYVKNLSPAPAPGSVSVDYLALGKWYRLQDDGAGGLTGDDGVGSGQVNYATGSLVVTLGALPDTNTQILFAWGTPTHYRPQVGASVFRPPAIPISLPEGAIEPSSVQISYWAGGVARAAIDDGVGGFIGDDAAGGWIDYATGKAILLPRRLPDGDSDLVIQYRQGGLVTEIFPAGGASNNFSLSHAVLPKSLSLSFLDTRETEYIVYDEGTGVLAMLEATPRIAVDRSGSSAGSSASRSSSINSTSGIGGSINYSTGAVALGVQVTYHDTSQSRSVSGSGSEITEQHTWVETFATVNAAGTITARYRPATDSAGWRADTVASHGSLADRSAADHLQYAGAGQPALHAGGQCLCRSKRPVAARCLGDDQQRCSRRDSRLHYRPGHAQRLCGRWRRAGDHGGLPDAQGFLGRLAVPVPGFRGAAAAGELRGARGARVG